MCGIRPKASPPLVCPRGRQPALPPSPRGHRGALGRVRSRRKGGTGRLPTSRPGSPPWGAGGDFSPAVAGLLQRWRRAAGRVDLQEGTFSSRFWPDHQVRWRLARPALRSSATAPQPLVACTATAVTQTGPLTGSTSSAKSRRPDSQWQPSMVATSVGTHDGAASTPPTSSSRSSSRCSPARDWTPSASP